MDLVAQFSDYLRHEKRYSPHTVRSYLKDLDQFSIFVSGEKMEVDWADIRFRDIRTWVMTMMNDGMEARSVNRKISSLKSFYRFLQREGHVKASPTERLIAPKMKKRLPVFIEEDKMVHLIDEVSFGDGFPGMRNRLMVYLFYASGIRLSELSGLKESSLSLRENTFKVLGKRNKERVIPMGPGLREEIELYLAEKEKAFPGTDYLFLTDKGKPLYPKFVYRVVTAMLSMVSTAEKKSPHVLRHTFATHMLNHGADLNAIKELLGHANLAATQVYTHNTFEKLRNIYQKAHPRA